MSAASELRGTAHHDQHWQVQTLCKESASMSSHFGVPLEALERPSRLARGLSADSFSCLHVEAAVGAKKVIGTFIRGEAPFHGVLADGQGPGGADWAVRHLRLNQAGKVARPFERLWWYIEGWLCAGCSPFAGTAHAGRVDTPLSKHLRPCKGLMSSLLVRLS